MRAARTIRIVPFAPPASALPVSRAPNSTDALTVLGEIVTQLSERVELLETRERIARAAALALVAGNDAPAPPAARRLPLAAHAGTFLAGTAHGRE